MQVAPGPLVGVAEELCTSLQSWPRRCKSYSRLSRDTFPVNGREQVSGDWERVVQKAEQVSQHVDDEQFDDWRPQTDEDIEDTRQQTAEQQSADGWLGRIEATLYQLMLKTNPCYFDGEKVSAVLEQHWIGNGYTLTVYR